jgi:hypothetical protein
MLTGRGMIWLMLLWCWGPRQACKVMTLPFGGQATKTHAVPT